MTILRCRQWLVMIVFSCSVGLLVSVQPSAAGFNPLDIFNRSAPKIQLTALRNPIARLYDFYSKTSLLPVLAPSGEKPGDVYADLLGGRYLARGRECFPKLKPTSATSNIPTLKDAVTLDLTGELHGAFNDAKLISGNAGLHFLNTGQIAFDKVTVSTTSAVQLRDALAKAKKACSDVTALLDGRPPGPGAEAGVILGSVWSGVMTAEWNVQYGVDGKLGADGGQLAKLVEAFAKKVGAKVKIDIGAQISVDGRVAQKITIVGKAVRPVAWLPIAISRPDLDDILAALKAGKIDILKNMYNNDRKQSPPMSNSEIRQRASREASFPLGTPQDVARRAERAPFLPLDIENAEHQQYVQTLGTLLALSYELSSEAR